MLVGHVGSQAKFFIRFGEQFFRAAGVTAQARVVVVLGVADKLPCLDNVCLRIAQVAVAVADIHVGRLLSHGGATKCAGCTQQGADQKCFLHDDELSSDSDKAAWSDPWGRDWDEPSLFGGCTDARPTAIAVLHRVAPWSVLAGDAPSRQPLDRLMTFEPMVGMQGVSGFLYRTRLFQMPRRARLGMPVALNPLCGDQK